MRHAALFVLLAAQAALSGCDALFAQAKTTRWLSQESLMGLVVRQDGDEIEAEMYVFDDAMTMPDPKAVGEDGFGGLPLAIGVYDAETKTIVVPLQTSTLVQANSARLLRKNGASYVELPFDLTSPTLEGRWRDGENPPKFTRTFVRCGQ
jgi:hypothetical protein